MPDHGGDIHAHAASLRPVGRLRGDDLEEDLLISQSVGQAVRFVAGAFNLPIGGIWWVDGVPGSVVVLLVGYEPLPGREKFLWVIVGDCPPLAIPATEPMSADRVLAAYCRIAEDWLNTPENEEWPPTGSRRTEEFEESVRTRVQVYRDLVIPWMAHGDADND